MTVRASVVVPTYKRPDLLARCLDALLAQDFDPAEFEIVVADDAGDERTCRQVESLAHYQRGRPLLRYVRVGGTSGPAGARNAGWRAAKGEIIAFTDDDCIPDRNWLAAGVAAFEAHVSGVSGKLVMPIPEPPTDYQLNAAHLEEAQCVTANCFYRRDTLEALSGFDERFKAAWREDCDLYFRFLKAGHTLATCDAAVVVHPVREAPWGVSVSQQHKSLFNALLYKKHPDLYRERVQSSPPWRYYAIVAALMTALLALLTGHRREAQCAFFVWLLLTGRFSAIRLARTSRTPSHVAEMIVTSAVIPPLAVFWRIRGAIRFRVVFL